MTDSFDYRNKYAIVQYLKDIGKDPLFKQIIMTHNFDFFRTLETRNVVRYSDCSMASRNDAGVNGITVDQTPALIEKFKELFPKEIETIAVLETVALMTPENIHLNSFMYEPIVDMSDEHLRRLYSSVVKLK